MKSQKCKISALILALVFAVFACPFAILQVQAEGIDNDAHQTAETTDPGTSNTEPDPPPTEAPPVSEPSLPPESSQTDPPPSSTISEDPTEEPPPATEAPPEPTWAPDPDPTEAPNYNQGNTATATPRPTRSPSSSSSTGIQRPTATLKPNTGADSSSSEQKESNYVTFATVNIKQNSFAANLFFGGVVCIILGAVGLVVLIVLFIKNRRSRKNDRDGIFEEIEQAETRSMAAQDGQPTAARPAARPQQHSGQMNRQPARQQPSMDEQVPRHTGYSERDAIKPADASMYTEELDIPAPRSAAPQPPAAPVKNPPPARPSSPSPSPAQTDDKQFNTEEILREALYQDDDYDDL